MPWPTTGSASRWPPGGCCRRQGGVAKIGRMAVHQVLRGCGFGEQVLRALAGVAQRRGDRGIELHAQRSAQRLLRPPRVHAAGRAVRGSRHPAHRRCAARCRWRAEADGQQAPPGADGRRARCRPRRRRPAPAAAAARLRGRVWRRCSSWRRRSASPAEEMLQDTLKSARRRLRRPGRGAAVPAGAASQHRAAALARRACSCPCC